MKVSGFFCTPCIYCGIDEELKSFESFLRAEFDVGELDKNELAVVGCKIAQDSTKSITSIQQLKQEEIYLAELKQVYNFHDNNDVACPQEITAYRSVIGKTLFVGHISRPVILYHASHIPTRMPKVFVYHLKNLSAIVMNDTNYTSKLRFLATPSDSRFRLETSSDTAMSNNKFNEGRMVSSYSVTVVTWCIPFSGTPENSVLSQEGAQLPKYSEQLMLQL